MPDFDSALATLDFPQITTGAQQPVFTTENHFNRDSFSVKSIASVQSVDLTLRLGARLYLTETSAVNGLLRIVEGEVMALQQLSCHTLHGGLAVIFGAHCTQDCARQSSNESNNALRQAMFFRSQATD